MKEISARKFAFSEIRKFTYPDIVVVTFGHKDLRKLFINIINIIGDANMENRGLLTYCLSLQIRLSDINLLSKNHFTFYRRIDNHKVYVL